MRAIYLIFTIVVLNTCKAYGQDVHLSQFYASDHLLNPANVGDHNGDYRITANYRSQWKQIDNEALTTFIGSFDKAFHYYSHEIDGGIMVLTDQFSGFKTNTTKFLCTGAYAYSWKKHIFRGGIQTGVVSNSTNLESQTFPEQWDYPNGQFNASLPTNETSIRASQLYIDINLGVNWTHQFKKMNVKAGIALNHINRPKNSYFTTQTERFRARKVLHAEVSYPLKRSFVIEPKAMWMWTTKANDLLLGSRLAYKTKHRAFTAVKAGVFYRHGVVRSLDAVYGVFGFEYKEFEFGVSYDLNVSTLHANIKRPTSFEFSLIYTAPSSKAKYKVIPCARY